jgi:anti-sigma regulatory factor (Ser/Thr protein kinase)
VDVSTGQQRPAEVRLVEACRAWHLSHLLFSAQLIVSELVANAVQHAGTDIGVTVSRRAQRLHLIVSDENHSVPELLAGSRALPAG